MIVELLQPNKKFLDKRVGDQFEVDAVVGNQMACVGIVRVIKHDPVPANAKRAVVRMATPDRPIPQAEDNDADEE